MGIFLQTDLFASNDAHFFNSEFGIRNWDAIFVVIAGCVEMVIVGDFLFLQTDLFATNVAHFYEFVIRNSELGCNFCGNCGMR